MKSKIYLALLLGCFFYYTGYGQAPNWQVNAENYRYSMSLVATGNDTCFSSMSTSDIIGVFDKAGTCRGKGNLISFSVGYRAIITVQGNDLMDTLFYRIYDASTNQIILSADTLKFAPEMILGSVSLPEIIEVTDCGPSVTIEQGSSQSDPTNSSSIVFDVVFSESVTGFDGNDVTVDGTAGATTATVSGSGTTYTVAVTGMTESGIVTATIPQGAAMNGVGQTSEASTSIDNEVTYDNIAPTITEFARKTPATSPTNADVLVFAIVFSKPVNNVTADDFTITGTTATGVIAGADSIYTLTVSGGDIAALNGTVGLDLASGQDIVDLVGNAVPTAEPATDEVYELDNTAPIVTTLSPIDNATEQEIITNLVITFNENVIKGTDSIKVYKKSDNSLVETISVTNTIVAIDGKTVTINPINDLVLQTDYYVQIASTVFKDAAGNNYTGITNTTDWSFKTINYVCPTLSTLSVPTEICAGNTFNLSTSALDNMTKSVNFDQDFGIKFVAFSAATTNPYTGGTSLGTVTFENLTGVGSNQTATLNNVGNTLAAGNYKVYVILSPTPTDTTCRPSENGNLTVKSAPNSVGLSASATNICIGASVIINLSGANNLTNGSYEFSYKVGNGVTQTANANMTDGAGSFEVAGLAVGQQTINIIAIKTTDGCSKDITDVSVTLEVEAINAGANAQDICGMTKGVAASIPMGSTGAWTITSANPMGSASINELTNNNMTLTGIFGGDYTIRWTANSGVCNNSFDEVRIQFNPDIDFVNPDGSLGDGVQDCVDLCIGGDDRINTDSTGMPDDCDCNVNDSGNEFVSMEVAEFNAYITEQLLLNVDTARRIADFQIISDAVIEAKPTHPVVIFEAGNAVLLKPGFHAKIGSDFIAKVDYCKDPISGQTNIEEINPVGLSASATNICTGTSVTINLSGANNLTNGSYEFSYKVGNGVTQTANANMTDGAGSFEVAGLAVGQQTINIIAIKTTDGCSKDITDVSATLEVEAINAGTNAQDICGMTKGVAASIPMGSTGAWTITSANPVGSASINELTNNNMTLTGVFGGDYTIRWTANSGVCNNSFDEVRIQFNPDIDFVNPDGSLGDGVQDCVDLCIGGDDRINTDGIGMPDDCDCNVNDSGSEFISMEVAEFNAYIMEQLLLNVDTAKQVADFQIISDAVIEAKPTHPVVIFEAGNAVNLKSGFHAKIGSDFTAKAGYCKGPISGQINKVEGTTPFQLNVSNTEEVQISPALIPTIDLRVFPNPIQQEAAIEIGLPQSGSIHLLLYNQNGQLVRQYLKGISLAKGVYYYKLDVGSLSNGIYFLRLQSDREVLTNKLVVQRY